MEGSWFQLCTEGLAPAARGGAACAAVNGQLLLFGGADRSATAFDDLWTLDIGVRAAPRWSRSAVHAAMRGSTPAPPLPPCGAMQRRPRPVPGRASVQGCQQSELRTCASSGPARLGTPHVAGGHVAAPKKRLSTPCCQHIPGCPSHMPRLHCSVGIKARAGATLTVVGEQVYLFGGQASSRQRRCACLFVRSPAGSGGDAAAAARSPAPEALP
jgi:hypothetical protein